MTRWDIYLRGRWINSCWFTAHMARDEVRRSLIDHDGLPADVTLIPMSTVRKGIR